MKGLFEIRILDKIADGNGDRLALAAFMREVLVDACSRASVLPGFLQPGRLVPGRAAFQSDRRLLVLPHLIHAAGLKLGFFATRFFLVRLSASVGFSSTRTLVPTPRAPLVRWVFPQPAYLWRPQRVFLMGVGSKYDVNVVFENICWPKPPRPPPR